MDPTWLAELDPNTVKPGALGLVVVLALVVATALLLRSFTRHLKKIDFDEDRRDEPPAAPEGGSAPRAQD
jgi:hypothetical protein